MTITDDTIKKAVQRYPREYNSSLELSARVAEGNAIRGRHVAVSSTEAATEGVARGWWFADRINEAAASPALRNPEDKD